MSLKKCKSWLRTARLSFQRHFHHLRQSPEYKEVLRIALSLLLYAVIDVDVDIVKALYDYWSFISL